VEFLQKNLRSIYLNYKIQLQHAAHLIAAVVINFILKAAMHIEIENTANYKLVYVL